MTTLPHTFKRIRLNLARSKEFPQGSAQHGYEFVAPLDDKGHIDVELWRSNREHCRVRRFWEGEDDEIGFLVHKPGGPEHARWVFDYDQTAERRRRERLPLRRPCVPPGRICLDPRRGRRDAHLPGGLGRAGDLSGESPSRAFEPCTAKSIDRHAPGPGECAPPPPPKRPIQGRSARAHRCSDLSDAAGPCPGAARALQASSATRCSFATWASRSAMRWRKAAS